MKCKTQTQAVLEHLQKRGSITSWQAFKRYGATRLSDIIFRLRKRGYTITTVTFEARTRFGNKSRPAKYILHKENE